MPLKAAEQALNLRGPINQPTHSRSPPLVLSIRYLTAALSLCRYPSSLSPLLR